MILLFADGQHGGGREKYNVLAWAVQVGLSKGMCGSSQRFIACEAGDRRRMSSSRGGSANLSVQEEKVGVSVQVGEAGGLLSKLANAQLSNKKNFQQQENLGPNYVKRLSKLLAKNSLEQATFATKKETRPISASKKTEDDSENGQDEAFVCEIKAGGEAAKGHGVTKLEAEQDAAGKVLQAFVKAGLIEDNKPTAIAAKGGGSFTLRPPHDAQWIRIDPRRHNLKPIVQERDVPIPELAHGLSRVISKDNQFATTLKQKIGGKSFDKEYCTSSPSKECA
jgi:hypothetical protein